MKKAVRKLNRKRKKAKPKRKLYRRVKTGKFREKTFIDKVREETAGDKSRELNPYLIYTDEWIAKEAEQFLLFFENGIEKVFPKDYAIYRGYPAENLNLFAKRSEIFNLALKRVKDICESRLVHLGFEMSRPTMPLFLLKTRYGYIERMDVTSEGKQVGVACVIFSGLDKAESVDAEK